MMASSYYQNLIKRVLDRDGMSVYRKVLEKAGVLVVPGASFGDLGEGYVRAALVTNCEGLERAVKKIKESGILD